MSLQPRPNWPFLLAIAIGVFLGVGLEVARVYKLDVTIVTLQARLESVTTQRDDMATRLTQATKDIKTILSEHPKVKELEITNNMGGSSWGNIYSYESYRVIYRDDHKPASKATVSGGTTYLQTR